MQTITAKDVKFGFGRLIDLAHGEPMRIAKNGRPKPPIRTYHYGTPRDPLGSVHQYRPDIYYRMFPR